MKNQQNKKKLFISKTINIFFYLWIFTVFLFTNSYANDELKSVGDGKSKYVSFQLFANSETATGSTEQGIAYKINVIYRFTIAPPFHINSANPLIDGLIPTTASIATDSGKLIKQSTSYPPDEILEISGFRTTVFKEGTHEITESYMYYPKKKRETDTANFNYNFTYQACKDDECYAPDSIKGDFRLSVLDNPSTFKKILNMDLLAMILFALVGGIILNFTPCVLPILSLKLISLSTMKETDYKHKKRYVAYYTFGVLCFFFILATTLSILKLVGEGIGWGIQFQNPYYIYFIILVLTLVTLNFFGVYELRFSYHSKLSGDSVSNSKTENWKNFGTGFLTVILATPCTVPFLGVAVAYAFSRNVIEIVLLHLFIAIGFLLPYLLIFINIDISKLLPSLRSLQGHIKKISGFILLITIFWLLEIYGNLIEIKSYFYIFVSLWIVGLIMWIFGQAQKRPLQIKTEVIFWLVLIAFLGWQNFTLTSYIANSLSNKENLYTTSSTNKNLTLEERTILNTGSSIVWQPFSKEILTTLQKSDSIIYVHFTADWCLNCKVNEKLVIENQNILELLKRANVITLKADWTKPNKEIFNEMQSLGRAGIPLDVFYRGKEQIIMPSILTTSIIKSALENIGNN